MKDIDRTKIIKLLEENKRKLHDFGSGNDFWTLPKIAWTIKEIWMNCTSSKLKTSVHWRTLSIEWKGNTGKDSHRKWEKMFDKGSISLINHNSMKTTNKQPMKKLTKDLSRIQVKICKWLIRTWKDAQYH